MAKTCRTSDGDLLDTLCYQHYGHLNGTVELVMQANQGLADEVQGFKVGLDGEYLVDSVEQTFDASGWTTAVECNGGKKGKAKARGKKKKSDKPLKVVDVNPA